jgi:hypothetical protein
VARSRLFRLAVYAPAVQDLQLGQCLHQQADLVFGRDVDGQLA